MYFRCINKDLTRTLQTIREQCFQHLGQKSAENFQMFLLGCQEFNTLMEDKAKRSKADWHCTLCASRLISQKDQYGKEVRKQRWRRQMFMSDYFFQTLIIHCTAGKKSQDKANNFSKAHPCCQTTGRTQWPWGLNARYLKTVLHNVLPHAVTAMCIQIIKYWL